MLVLGLRPLKWEPSVDLSPRHRNAGPDLEQASLGVVNLCPRAPEALDRVTECGCGCDGHLCLLVGRGSRVGTTVG